jgi:hypothetical protein
MRKKQIVSQMIKNILFISIAKETEYSMQSLQWKVHDIQRNYTALVFASVAVCSTILNIIFSFVLSLKMHF